jgi:CubicO group peptidase (beta-lactamase class C family)
MLEMSTTRRQFLVALPLLALPMTWTGQASAQLATRRDYWPTADWRTAPPEEYGIDPAALADVDGRVPSETPDLSALLVVRHGYLVFERYYGGHTSDQAINVRSITKSVTGTLIGIALAEGQLRDLDQTVGELIPDRIPAGADPNVANVTLRQLLTMTSGLAWDAATDYPTLIASDDWVALTLSLPVVGVPGETFVYNSGGSHLLAVILAAATGRDTLDYGNEKLFRPIGMKPKAWARSPQGERIGGFGLELTARDMARFGNLYLNGGVWDGEQVVSADWVAASTTWQATGDATGGWAAYGYQWWVTATNAGYPAYFALGYGGQHIFVVPDLDLVVVTGIARRVPPEELRTPRYLIESIAAGTAPQV